MKYVKNHAKPGISQANLSSHCSTSSQNQPEPNQGTLLDISERMLRLYWQKSQSTYVVRDPACLCSNDVCNTPREEEELVRGCNHESSTLILFVPQCPCDYCYWPDYLLYSKVCQPAFARHPPYESCRLPSRWVIWLTIYVLGLEFSFHLLFFAFCLIAYTRCSHVLLGFFLKAKYYCYGERYVAEMRREEKGEWRKKS